MSINELEMRIEKMQEWESLAEEAKKEAEAIKAEIKEDIGRLSTPTADCNLVEEGAILTLPFSGISHRHPP